LRDPVDRVRLSAARALSTAGAHEAIPALQAFANTVSHQEAVMVRTWVARLRKKRGAEPSAKDEVLDELREKVRKLEEAVDKLEARVTPAEEER
jgi:HEAT repeat protein